MIKYIKGDLLSTDAEIIMHQVNLQGVMGGGLALSIARKYPEVEKDYILHCKFNDYDCGGMVCFSQIYNTNNRYIANCFSQNADFTTNYKWLEQCCEMVKNFASKGDKIAIPYKYGCGIAKGDWNIVENIFKEKFKDYDLLIYQL